ncbi:MAG: type II toxin-antitoxin system RatA family toxin [Candidatus Paracaedibacteraceae bacterium]|nr:type II toxin-antitoxin system RatA family toxin [Candidatus Paracaedibacteraceae bacterium]
MPKLFKTACVTYSDVQLFQLVSDVEKYPDFLPFCSKTIIHKSTETLLIADMHIGYKGFSGAFQSEVTKRFPVSLDMKQTHGSLKYLTSSWVFKKVSTMQPRGVTMQPECIIEFRVDFEPSSWLVGKLVSPLMNEIADMMMQAFIKRADFLYGNNKI